MWDPVSQSVAFNKKSVLGISKESLQIPVPIKVYKYIHSVIIYEMARQRDGWE